MDLVLRIFPEFNAVPVNVSVYLTWALRELQARHVTNNFDDHTHAEVARAEEAIAYYRAIMGEVAEKMIPAERRMVTDITGGVHHLP